MKDMFTEEFKTFIVRLLVILLVPAVAVLGWFEVKAQQALPKEEQLTKQAIVVAEKSQQTLKNVLLSLTPTPTATPASKFAPLTKPTVKPLSK